MKQKKRTKIVCTIGPSSGDLNVLKKMMKAGMNVARFNFSHGVYEKHAEMIKNLRQAAEETGEPVAILQDLQGPKIRVGELPDSGVILEQGTHIVLSTEERVELPKIGLTYQNLHNDVRPGARLLLDDGLIEMKVISILGKDITCEVVTGGVLYSHKGLNLPTVSLSIPAITAKDQEDLRFGVAQDVDWVALSFVRTAKEIYDLRELIKKLEEDLGGQNESRAPIRVVAKIEKHEAIKNIDEIIEAADGIMIARGDLGIEMPAEEVPILQKVIIDKCREKAKPVIVATQMLDSMVRNPRPTRAEVSDVANAVIDHADAVMLSAESATGKYPVETVETMSRIIHETEKSRFDDVAMVDQPVHAEVNEAILEVANFLARGIDAKLILVASFSAEDARLVSRYRPEMPILVAASEARVLRQLNLCWGVRAFLLLGCAAEELIDRSVNFLKKNKWVKTGDKIIVVAGEFIAPKKGKSFVEVKEIY
jgi:pyruvate kinase